MCPRLRIEDKHTYLNYSARIDGNNRTNGILTPISVFRVQEPYWPVQGTDENNRIGRKIQTSSIHHEGYISLPLSSDEGNVFWTLPTILDGWNGYLQDLVQRLRPDNYEFPASKTSFSIPIRHMWVEFYDEDFQTGTASTQAVYLQDWFKNLTVQIGSNSEDVPSVQTKMLRESTQYTGNFKILKDTMYWLSPDKPLVHFNEEIPFRRSLSFEAAGSDPSNARIYSLWIGPIQPLYDYFNSGFGQWMSNSNENPEVPFVCANVSANIKLKYIDL